MDFFLFFFFWSISPTPAIISENFPLKNEPRDKTLTQAETKIFSLWNLTMSWRDIIKSLSAKEIKELKSRTLKIRASWFVRYTRILILSSLSLFIIIDCILFTSKRKWLDQDSHKSNVQVFSTLSLSYLLWANYLFHL